MKNLSVALGEKYTWLHRAKVHSQAKMNKIAALGIYSIFFAYLGCNFGFDLLFKPYGQTDNDHDAQA